ncbi:alpha/beta fold hydrolase [Kitasatospora sp. NPDC058965]|uniref:alpha/beta fold hydrolase n=1 Tax=Kitasatospora sp. NPDC058965 TaxID=3346682 RepID=UPI00367ECD0D
MLSSAPAVDHTVSSDGTRIGFERLGSGPALVLVQGAMGTAYSFRELAEALADAFTVVVPDRRGRGLSPRPYSPDYTPDDDVRDLDAVLRATGAHHVFGLSSGADIALKAALALPRLTRLALYEPAVFPDGLPRGGLARFDAYAEAGDLAGMLVAGMKMAEFGPALLRAVPDRLVKRAVGGIMKQEAKQGTGGYAPMADLARAFPYDVAVVRSMDGSLPTFGTLTQPVLLLGGSKSPAYLARTLDRLEQVVPDVRRVELAGLDHAAAWNVDRRRNPHGDPRAVADRLKAFFLAG